MPLRNIKPLHILWQQSALVGMLDGVIRGIVGVLSLAGVLQNFQLKYFCQRRQRDWLSPTGRLNPYQSLDWHIWWAGNAHNSKLAGHLNSTALLNSLGENPAHATDPRYELVVVNEPLHWHATSLRKVGGIGRCGQGAIITVGNYLHLLQPVTGESDKEKEKRQFDFSLATRMLTMHELGHVFGLFPGTGKKNPTDEELKEAHCLNECVMHWKEDSDLERKIKDRPFCPSCLEKLKQFFIKP